MKAWEIVFGWNDGRQEEPKEDGRYYVATYYSGLKRLDITTLDYTTDYGWNTSRRYRESGFEIEDPYWWTPVISLDPGDLIGLRDPRQEATA